MSACGRSWDKHYTMQHAARRLPRAGACSATTALLVLAFGSNCQAADERVAGASLGLLDSVHVALARNPSVVNSGYQVDIAQGQLLQAQSPFDTVLSASLANQRKHTPSTSADQLSAGEGAADSVVSDETNSGVRLTQLMRNGVTIEPALSISRATDNSPMSQQSPTISSKSALMYS